MKERFHLEKAYADGMYYVIDLLTNTVNATFHTYWQAAKHRDEANRYYSEQERKAKENRQKGW